MEQYVVETRVVDLDTGAADGMALIDDCVTIHHAFRLGYESGRRGETSSPRDVYTRYPTWDNSSVETYLAGQDDGRAGDTWRLRGGLTDSPGEPGQEE